MHAELIAIGDEILSGQHLDTNSAWLSQRLEELGVKVLYHSAVGDELAACADVFRRAMDRADVVVSTGGLGPTADDLTRQALAQAAGRPLELYPDALEHMRLLFASRKREMPAQNRVQAMFPAGSRMIPNAHGTAPGIDLEVSRAGKTPCRFFALPGVPAEMMEIWNTTLSAEIAAIAAGQNVIRRLKINCFGAGESQVEAMLPDLIRRGRSPTVGITASKATISLRITAQAPTAAQCDALIAPTAATIRKCLGALVFGEGDDQLQHAVIRLLLEKKRTLATLEWGTRGIIADWLGEASVGNDCFLGGLVVQDRNRIGRLLELDEEGLAGLPPSGEEYWKRAAAACKARFAADYALAVGPFPEFYEKNPRPVHLALAAGDGIVIKSIPYAAHPALLRVYIAKSALNMVRLALME
jgi:nicotinamide-nucleotide amidase